MKQQFSLMAVLAHPDDETLGFGGTLARYATEGVRTSVITATRGEHGWSGPAGSHPGPDAVAELRRRELCAAAEALGVHALYPLAHEDGTLERVDPPSVAAEIAALIRREQPQVLLTFDPCGDYGHPDHIAVSRLTMAAAVAAATPGSHRPGHQVSKIYFRVATAEEQETYQAIFGPLRMEVNGHVRHPVHWPAWAITTRIYTAPFQKQVMAAIRCHRSQIHNGARLHELTMAQRRVLFGEQSFYRAMSLVRGARGVEKDLFAGLQQYGRK
jgi:LmbE family N-acetylglucosaminyl deacetylase